MNRRKSEVERWWVTFTHDRWGEVKVCMKWVHVGRGVFQAITESVQFDLTVPYDEQEILMGLLKDAEISKVDQHA